MSENPTDLVRRWRERAASMENGDGASKLAAYHLRFVADELESVGFVQFWTVAYGDGYQPEESYEYRDEAQDRLDDAIDAGDEDAKLITAWFTGWRDAETSEPVLLS